MEIKSRFYRYLLTSETYINEKRQEKLMKPWVQKISTGNLSFNKISYLIYCWIKGKAQTNHWADQVLVLGNGRKSLTIKASRMPKL